MSPDKNRIKDKPCPGKCGRLIMRQSQRCQSCQVSIARAASVKSRRILPDRPLTDMERYERSRQNKLNRPEKVWPFPDPSPRSST